MTTTKHVLPDELVLEGDGHLADVALTAIADGEVDLVPSAALAHLDGCDHCSHRLGEAALLSVATREALISSERELGGEAPIVSAAPLMASRAEAPVVAPPAPELPVAVAPIRRRRPLPVAAIAAALAIAVLTAGPSVVDAVQSAPATIHAALGSVPFLARAGSAFLRNAPWDVGHLALLIKLASALGMVAVGLRFARLRSLAGTNEMNGGVG